MRRRTLLGLGAGASIVLALAGGSALWLHTPLDGGRLNSPARAIFLAMARAVLDGALPDDAAERTAALASCLDRIQQTISGLPGHTRDELSRLLALLATTPGRRLLAELAADWDDATVPELQQALSAMRRSRWELPQQAYHALRDLTCGAYFADASTWPVLGYPGPRTL